MTRIPRQRRLQSDAKQAGFNWMPIVSTRRGGRDQGVVVAVPMLSRALSALPSSLPGAGWKIAAGSCQDE